uniref:Uncharacterized protein n=1 Tax=Oryza rufipogon TaxID=4529 RepID=A0A0E0QHU9_ORYRU
VRQASGGRIAREKEVRRRLLLPFIAIGDCGRRFKIENRPTVRTVLGLGALKIGGPVQARWPHAPREGPA